MKKKIKLCFVAICVIMIFSIFVIINSRDESLSKDMKEHRLQWWYDKIGCTADISAGEGISIALIDSGVFTTHPDLAGCDIEFIDLLEEGQTVDLSHGTAMAGVICAQAEGNKGLIGLVPSAKIYDIRTVDSSGFCEVDKLIEAIEIAIEKKVDIINLSICTKKYSEKLEKVVYDALDKNIIIVAATSNYGFDDVIYPASFDGVVKVGAVDKKGDFLYNMKNYNDDLIIKSPGKSIVTTLYKNGKLYSTLDGTSIATAITSGTLARIIYENPNMDRKNIINKLYDMKVINTNIK